MGDTGKDDPAGVARAGHGAMIETRAQATPGTAAAPNPREPEDG
ncbi:hypothetical protein [Cereibacter sphaeroides]|nr:hypothetical protein [Cereibacter sphaeroides]